MRNLAERITRFKPLQTFIYWAEYSVITFILGAPLAIYEGYIRERQYGLATQTFGPWAWDQTKSLLIGIVLGGLLVMAAVRDRSPPAAHLVDMGRSRHHVVPHLHRFDRPCLSSTYLQ